MKLQTLRELIVAEVMYAATRYGTKPTLIEDKILVAWISQAIQDISYRIHTAKNVTSFQIFKGTNTYSLPADFGSIITATIDNKHLQQVPFNDLLLDIDATPKEFALWYRDYDRITLSPSPDQTYTLTLWYNIGTLAYDPDSTAQQTFGTFDGNTGTGDIRIPDRYSYAITKYVLSRIYLPEMQQYEYEIQKLKQIELSSTSHDIKYRLGI